MRLRGQMIDPRTPYTGTFGGHEAHARTLLQRTPRIHLQRPFFASFSFLLHSSHLTFWCLWGQILDPSHSLHWLLRRAPSLADFYRGRPSDARVIAADARVIRLALHRPESQLYFRLLLGKQLK